MRHPANRARARIRVPEGSQESMTTMRSDNKGLTVKVNLFSMEKFLERFDSKKARLWMKGVVTNATGERANFNDAGELISILGKWNSKRFRDLQKAAR